MPSRVERVPDIQFKQSLRERDDRHRHFSPDIALRGVGHQPGKRLAIGLFRLNQRVEVEVENELASIAQFERRFAFQTVHETYASMSSTDRKSTRLNSSH